MTILIGYLHLSVLSIYPCIYRSIDRSIYPFYKVVIACAGREKRREAGEKRRERGSREAERGKKTEREREKERESREARERVRLQPFPI